MRKIKKSLIAFAFVSSVLGISSISANAQEVVGVSPQVIGVEEGLSSWVTGTTGVNRRAHVTYVRMTAPPTTRVFAQGQVRIGAPGHATFNAPRIVRTRQATTQTDQFSARGTLSWVLRTGGIAR